MPISDDDRAAIKKFGKPKRAKSTEKHYRDDWKSFVSFCLSRKEDPYSGNHEVVMAYAVDQTAHVSPNSIDRRLCAIKAHYNDVNLDSPTDHRDVRSLLKSIRQALRRAPVRKTPLTEEQTHQMMDRCPNSKGGWRDRFIIGFLFETAMRRSEFADLDMKDVEVTPRGLRITIARSKNDQYGNGAVLPEIIRRDDCYCIVSAFEKWTDMAQIYHGKVLRPLRIEAQFLRAKSIGDVFKKYVKKIGLNPDLYSAGSARSGKLTSESEKGATILDLMQRSRHKSISGITPYLRRKK